MHTDRPTRRKLQQIREARHTAAVRRRHLRLIMREVRRVRL